MLDAHTLILPQHVLHIELTVTRHIMFRRNIHVLLHGLFFILKAKQALISSVIVLPSVSAVFILGSVNSSFFSL